MRCIQTSNVEEESEVAEVESVGWIRDEGRLERSGELLGAEDCFEVELIEVESDGRRFGGVAFDGSGEIDDAIGEDVFETAKRGQPALREVRGTLLTGRIGCRVAGKVCRRDI